MAKSRKFNISMKPQSCIFRNTASKCVYPPPPIYSPLLILSQPSSIPSSFSSVLFNFLLIPSNLFPRSLLLPPSPSSSPFHPRAIHNLWLAGQMEIEGDRWRGKAKETDWSAYQFLILKRRDATLRFYFSSARMLFFFSVPVAACHSGKLLGQVCVCVCGIESCSLTAEW